MASESKKAEGKDEKPTGALDAGDIALLTTYVRDWTPRATSGALAMQQDARLRQPRRRR